MTSSLVAAVLILRAADVCATTIKIPQQKPTIQKGIVAALDRDTVLVAPGIYQELLSYMGKAILVQSEGGADVTILKPVDMVTPVAIWGQSESRGAVLDGFTVTGYNAAANPSPIGALEFSNRASPTIRNCVFRDNHGVMMGRVADDGPTFIRCLFYNNTGAPTLGIWGAIIGMLNCTIDRCEYGIFVSKSDCEVRNTNITNCTYYGVHGLITLFDYNNVWNNGVDLESGTVPGVHDISVDPKYMNPAAGDYRLAAGSPCIDNGDPNPYLVDPDGTRGDIGYSYFQGPTDVNDETSLPSSFALAQNYPNPFNPSTRIAFTLPHRTDTKLEVFSVLGARVRVLLDQPLSAGDHVAGWDGLASDGTRSASGVYFYRLQTDDFIATKKMVLLK